MKIVDNKAYRRLAAAILLQAVADLRRDSELDRVNTFVESWWFEALCSGVDIDPASARRALARRTLINRPFRKAAESGQIAMGECAGCSVCGTTRNRRSTK